MMPGKRPVAIRLSASKNTMVTPATRPKCPVHGFVLKFVPENARWECPLPNGCDYVKYPETDDALPIMGKGKPFLVGYRKGGELRLFLKYENGVMAPLSDITRNFVMESNQPIRVVIALSDYREFDSDGNAL